MCRCSSFLAPALLTVAGIAAVAGSIAFAQPGADKKPTTPAKPTTAPAGQPTGMPEMTPQQMADMQACTEAGTPGAMHANLMKRVGTWTAKTQMWMGPDDKTGMTSNGTYTVTNFMDGRYVKGEMNGEMPGMGTFMGFCLAGYDNVSKKFVSTWVDNHSTGIMNGTGELSKDAKTINWSYDYNCPVNKKPTKMREIETLKSDNEMTLEMFGADPHSGKEFKMMHITFTRTGGAVKAPAGH